MDGGLSLFRNRFDNLMDDLFLDSVLGGRPSLLENSLSPDVNVSETDSKYQVEADLPGISKDDIEISYVNNALTLKTERKEQREEKGKHYHRVESRFGSIQRVISIPGDIEEDKIDAKFENGVLSIVLPKEEKVRNKAKIEIK